MSFLKQSAITVFLSACPLVAFGNSSPIVSSLHEAEGFQIPAMSAWQRVELFEGNRLDFVHRDNDQVHVMFFVEPFPAHMETIHSDFAPYLTDEAFLKIADLFAARGEVRLTNKNILLDRIGLHDALIGTFEAKTQEGKIEDFFFGISIHKGEGLLAMGGGPEGELQQHVADLRALLHLVEFERSPNN